jgi:hypothetical protein
MFLLRVMPPFGQGIYGSDIGQLSLFLFFSLYPQHGGNLNNGKWKVKSGKWKDIIAIMHNTTLTGNISTAGYGGGRP